MQCQVLYNIDSSKTIQINGFSDIEEAKKWLNEKSDSDFYQNARIVVDYAAIETFQEMFNLMKNKIFEENSSKKVFI